MQDLKKMADCLQLILLLSLVFLISSRRCISVLACLWNCSPFLMILMATSICSFLIKSFENLTINAWTNLLINLVPIMNYLSLVYHVLLFGILSGILRRVLGRILGGILSENISGSGSPLVGRIHGQILARNLIGIGIFGEFHGGIFVGIHG